MNEIIFNIHDLNVILQNNPERFKEVFIINKKYNFVLKSLILNIKNNKIPVKITNIQWMNNILKGQSHYGILAYVKPKITYQEKDLLSFVKKIDKPFFLILDNVTDPHNLGACLRTAEGAGLNAVIIPKNNSAKLNNTVKKVACGASEFIPLIRVTNLSRTISLLQENHIWIIGATRKSSKVIYNSKMTGALAIIMGSENKGLRYLTSKYCNELVGIPMFGKLSSLNVSVAAGIFLFEAIRQRILC